MSFWDTPDGKRALEARAMDRKPLHEAMQEHKVATEPRTVAGRTMLATIEELVGRPDSQPKWGYSWTDRILAIEAEASGAATSASTRFTADDIAKAQASEWQVGYDAGRRASGVEAEGLDVEAVLRKAFPVRAFGSGEPVDDYPDWDKRTVTLREVIDALAAPPPAAPACTCDSDPAYCHEHAAPAALNRCIACDNDLSAGQCPIHGDLTDRAALSPADHCDHGMSAHGPDGCIHCECKVPGFQARPPAAPATLDDRKAITALAEAACHPRGPEAVDYDDAWAVLRHLREKGITLARLSSPEASDGEL